MTEVREVMTTDVETVRADETVASVISKLTDREFDGFPVVDGSGRLVGVVTMRDLLTLFQPEDGIAWVPVGLPPFTEVVDYAVDVPWEDADLDMDLSEHGENPVSTVMTENVVTVTPTNGLDHALALLADEDLDVNRLPVVEDGAVVGILTRQDVLGALRDEREATAGTESATHR